MRAQLLDGFGVVGQCGLRGRVGAVVSSLAASLRTQVLALSQVVVLVLLLLLLAFVMLVLLAFMVLAVLLLALLPCSCCWC